MHVISWSQTYELCRAKPEPHGQEPRLANWCSSNRSLNYDYLATSPVASVSQVLQVERREATGLFSSRRSA